MENEVDDFGDPVSPPPQHGAPHKSDFGDVDSAMAASTPAAKFETVGTIVKGVIISADMAQQRDFMTGKPKFWDDGNPCTQILIVLQTDERSADIDDDTGLRMLYVKKPGGMLKAIAAALGKTKLSQAIGGTLAVKYTGDGTPPAKGMSPPKLYAARFIPIGGTAVATGLAAAVPLKITDSKTPTNKKAAWQEFLHKTPNMSKERRAESWRETVAFYGKKPAAELTSAEWNLLANKIAEHGPYVKELPPSDDEDDEAAAEAEAALGTSDIPF